MLDRCACQAIAAVEHEQTADRLVTERTAVLDVVFANNAVALAWMLPRQQTARKRSLDRKRQRSRSASLHANSDTHADARACTRVAQATFRPCAAVDGQFTARCQGAHDAKVQWPDAVHGQ